MSSGGLECTSEPSGCYLLCSLEPRQAITVPVGCMALMNLARTVVEGRDHALSPGRLEELCELKSEVSKGLGSSSEPEDCYPSGQELALRGVWL